MAKKITRLAKNGFYRQPRIFFSTEQQLFSILWIRQAFKHYVHAIYNNLVSSGGIFDCQIGKFDCHLFLPNFDGTPFQSLKRFLILVFCKWSAKVLTFTSAHFKGNMKRSLFRLIYTSFPTVPLHIQTPYFLQDYTPSNIPINVFMN